MTTTYTNNEEMNTLDALEIIEWGSHELRKPVLSLIKHLMDGAEGYTIHVSVTQTRTVITLADHDGAALKMLSLRHWLDSYAGAQVIGGGAYALVNNKWINL